MKHIPLIVSAFLFVSGMCGTFVFLTVNDPDRVASDVITRFAWLVLSPVAFLFSIPLRLRCWLGALAMLAGLFLGVCVRGIIPPHQSNIWPIAAFLWTMSFLTPVAAGAATGGIVGSLLWRFSRDHAP